jgi:hypothetical protein
LVSRLAASSSSALAVIIGIIKAIILNLVPSPFDSRFAALCISLPTTNSHPFLTEHKRPPARHIFRTRC